MKQNIGFFFLNDSDYIENSSFFSILSEVDEIIKMLTSSIKTSKRNL